MNRVMERPFPDSEREENHNGEPQGVGKENGRKQSEVVQQSHPEIPVFEIYDEPAQEQHRFQKLDAAARRRYGDMVLSRKDDCLVQRTFHTDGLKQQNGQRRADFAQRGTQEQMQVIHGAEQNEKDEIRKRELQRKKSASRIGVDGSCGIQILQ